MKTEIATINMLARLIEQAEQVHGRDAALLWAAIEPQLPPDSDGGPNLREVARTAIENYTGQPVLEQDTIDVTKFVGEHCELTIVDEAVTLVPVTDLCTVCGLPLAVGQQGCILRVIPHEPVLEYHPFKAYFDLAMGEQIDSHGQRMRMMRGEKNCDGDEIRPRLEYRDHVSRGEQSARHDRIRERQKAEGRR